MSKYIDMLADKYRCHCGTCEVQKGNVSEEECKICSHYAIREALQIADRLEQADADVYNKCCEVCTLLTICKERGEVCAEASAWEDGYNRALADIRGDAE